VDPTGCIVETGWDLFNLGLDCKSAYENFSEGNIGAGFLDVLAGVVDGLAVVAPGIPGGVGANVKAARTADKALDAVKATDKATDALKAVDKATDVVESGTKSEKTYQTYKKVNKETGEVYVGRTSGTGTPQQNVKERDRNHHMNKKGYGPADLQKSSKNKDAIRYEEQREIDELGGPKSGKCGNSINGISPNNPNLQKYLDAWKQEFEK